MKRTPLTRKTAMKRTGFRPSRPSMLKRSPMKRRPKPVSWHHGSAAGLRHMLNVKKVGCVIPGCGKYAEAHHPMSMRRGSRASDFDTISLCFDHHSNQSPLPFGEAIHNGTETFCAKYGTEPELLEQTRQRLRRAGLDDGLTNSQREE